jgi:hypothetical protein
MFLDLRVYVYFAYETLIPMRVSDLILALKGTFLLVPTCMWPPLCSSGSSFAWHAVQHGCPCPFFVHPQCQKRLLFVIFVLCLSVIVFWEVILK